MIKYLSFLFFLGHTLAQSLAFTIDQDEGKLLYLFEQKSNIKIGGGYLSDNFTDRIGEPLKEGYISLQSEGHPIEFKNIRIRELIE